MREPTEVQYAPQDGFAASAIPLRCFTEAGAADPSHVAMRTALDMSADTFLQVSPFELALVDANHAACINLGYSYDELLEMSLPEVAPRIEHGEAGATLETLLPGDAGASHAETLRYSVARAAASPHRNVLPSCASR